MSEQEKRDMQEESGGRAIRNRDIVTLSNVLYAMQDVSMTEERRMWLQDRLTSMSQQITGMPRGGGPTGGMEEKFAIIDELEEKYAKENSAFLEELRKAETILNSIGSRKMRTFVVMRYVMGIGNAEIQEKLCMKRRRFEQLCKLIEQAPNMGKVKWPEGYRLKDGK